MEQDTQTTKAKADVEAELRGSVGSIAAKVLQTFSYERMGQDLVICVKFDFTPPNNSAAARRYANGLVVSCWQASLAERLRFLFCGKVWLSILTFNTKLQPHKMSFGDPIAHAAKLAKARQKNCQHEFSAITGICPKCGAVSTL